MAFGKNPSEGHHTGLSIFEDYPAKVARLSGKEKKRIKKTARDLFKESPGDAISFLSGYRGYTNFKPDSLIGKYSAKDVNYKAYRPIADVAYQDFLGRPMSEAEWSDATGYAKAMGAKDPSSFQALLNSRILSANPGAVKSEADLDWERQYGPMRRDAQGYQRGLFRVDPANVATIASSMLGT